ncbi:MAG: hypothetical protein GXP62_07505 [Oligoflexia bacterium]|nr:hypothetical protein [Oligoflexia bacterium]
MTRAAPIDGPTAELRRILDDPDRLPTVLAVTHDLPSQDVIYEQLARLGAYGRLDPDRVRAWGYRAGPVLDRPESGLRAAVFLPLPGAAAPTTPQGHAMLELHGAPLRPVLAFRGATLRQGVVTDLDAQGIGSFQLAANDADIVAALRGARSRIDLVGHGIGGVVAQLAASRYPQAIGRVVTFQAPPVDQQDAAQVAAWNDRVAPHQRVVSAHHRAGPDVQDGAGELRTPGRIWFYGIATLEALNLAMPLAHLAAARGGGVPGVTDLLGRPVGDRLVSVRQRPVLGGTAESADQRLAQAVADGLDRRSPQRRDSLQVDRLEGLRVQVLEMATSTAFGFRRIVAFVQGQDGISSQQKVLLQEEARRRYRQGR